jgi:hypothetical protein
MQRGSDNSDLAKGRDNLVLVGPFVFDDPPL